MKKKIAAFMAAGVLLATSSCSVVFKDSEEKSQEETTGSSVTETEESQSETTETSETQSEESQTEATEASETEVKETEAQVQDSPASDSQLDVIAQNLDTIKWDFMADSDLYYNMWYTVSDFNHNGRLEFILSSIQGSGAYSYTNIYEVSEDHKSLEMIDFNGEESMYGDFLASKDPETNIAVYDCYSKNDKFYYVVEDYVSSGWGYKVLMFYSYSFGDKVTGDYIGGCELSAETKDDKTIVNLWLHGTPDLLFETDEDYLAFFDTYWADYTRVDQCELLWISFTEDMDFASGLTEAYDAYDPNSSAKVPISYNYHDSFDNFYGDEDYEYVINIG